MVDGFPCVEWRAFMIFCQKKKNESRTGNEIALNENSDMTHINDYSDKDSDDSLRT